jgi:DNA polymerase-1
MLASETGHELPRLILDYREIQKLRGTYTDALPKSVSLRTGRIHTSYHQTGAVTGRLSSSEPNLQNIPIRTAMGREIRRAFVPSGTAEQPTLPVGRASLPADSVGRASLPAESVGRASVPTTPATCDKLIVADYSQIELRILAHFCRDEALIKAFTDDLDIHVFVAAQVNGVALADVTREMRDRAKAVNFGIIYGQTAFGLARGTGMSQSDARKFIDDYFARYPRIRGFIEQCIDTARRDGAVTTILGRRREIDGIDARNRGQRALAERLAVNTVIQGSAADMIKTAMNHLHQRIAADRLPLRMLLQVHDELVCETPAADAPAHARLVEETMRNAIPLSVPVKVEAHIGDNWLDAK